MLSGFFKAIDSFSQPISLNLKKEYKHRTSVGGVFTILMVLALALFLFSKVTSFFEKGEIIVSQQAIFEKDPTLLKLPKEKFMFAITLEQIGVDFIEKPMFHIEVQYRRYEKVPGQKKIKEKLPLLMEPCTINHWKNIKGGINAEKIYEDFQLQNWLCPVLGQEFNVEGQFTSDMFQFLKFNLADCNTEKNNEKYWPSWNHTCATQEERDTHLGVLGDFRFNMLYSNHLINAQSKDYVKTFINQDYTFTFVPGQLYRECDIYITDHKVITDNQIYPSFEDKKIEEDFPIMTGEMREQLHLSKREGEYGSFYLRRSKNSLNYHREFMKIEDLLSYIGGFSEIVYISFGILVAYWNQQHQLITLSNTLYNFEDKEKKQRKYEEYKQQRLKNQQQKSKMNKRASQIQYQVHQQREYVKEQFKMAQNQNNKSKIQQISLAITQRLGFNTKLDFLIYQLQEYVHKISRVTLSLKFYIFQISGGKLCRSNHNLLLESGIEQAENQIDISQMIEKMNEIGKLKRILLDQEQQSLFDFAPKPLIKIRSTSQSDKNKFQSRLSLGEIDQHSRNNLKKLSLFHPKGQQKKQQLRQKLKINFQTYMTVIKAKNKFLNLIKGRRNKPSIKGLEAYVNLYHAYVNISDRLKQEKKNRNVNNLRNTSQNIIPIQEDNYQKSEMQYKINKELISQMGSEMKDIFDISKLLELPQITENIYENSKIKREQTVSIQGSQRSIQNDSQNTIQPQPKDKQLQQQQENFSNNKEQNTGMNISFQDNNENITNPNIKLNIKDAPSDHLPQFTSDIDIEQFNEQLTSERSYSKNQFFRNFRSQSRSPTFQCTERDELKTPNDNSNIHLNDIPQDEILQINNNSRCNNNSQIPIFDTSNWSLPEYARKQINSNMTLKNNEKSFFDQNKD